jgi:hypothetical protein
MEFTPSSKPRTGGYQKRSQRGGYQKRGGRRGTNQQYQTRYYPNRNNQAYYQQYRPNQMYPPYYNPVMTQEMIYQTEMYIFTKYRHLLDINVKSSGLSKTINESCTFYVIKSFSEEDVHKSIKYNVWSSSKNGNLTLTNSFNLTKEKNGFVYLFFSCNGSGRFIGVARMKTPCDNDKSFEYWTQDQKWMGLFEVEWMFIKDVPFKEFKDIIITMKDGETKPISNSRDVQEVPFDAAKKMILIFENYQNTNTILEHFPFYDNRQENYMKQMKNIKDVKEQQQQQNVAKEGKEDDKIEGDKKE